MTLVSDIVNSVMTELSLIPGLAVNTYASPKILQHVQDSMKLVVREVWWPKLMRRYNGWALDGVTGSLTADLTMDLNPVTDFEDINMVWPTGSNRALSALPPRTNPSVLIGDYPFFLEPNYTVANRPFIVYPLASTGPIDIWARSMPTFPISLTDTVLLDDLLLTYMATWMYAEDDATAPGQIAKFKNLAEKRMEAITKALNNQPLALDPRYISPLDGWWEVM